MFYSIEEAVCGNLGTRAYVTSVMIVQTGVIFDKFQESSIQLIYTKGGLDVDVCSNTTGFANGSQGQDVGKRVGVVHHWTKASDVPNVCGYLGATTSIDLEAGGTLVNVGEKPCVENIHSLLTIKDPSV